MIYKVGSFNVHNLSYFSNRDKLDAIANIINQFDIIALQEVLSGGKMLPNLKFRLGDNWECSQNNWLDPQTDSKWYPYLGDDKRGEGYVFIWRKDKFTLPINEKGKAFEPRIYRQYKVNRSSGEMRLIRDPAYGRFQFIDMPTAELRLIDTHIVYKKPSQDNLAKDVDFGSYTMRQNEFRVLAREIYTRINDNRNFYNNAVPYTIILGDYNLNLAESGAGSPIVPSALVFDEQQNELKTSQELGADGIYHIRTEQTDLSTVNHDGNQYSSNYDHFSYDETVKSAVVQGSPHRLKSVVEEAGGFKEYKEKVSDHIPVMVEISFK